MYLDYNGYHIIHIPLGNHKKYALREHTLNALLKYSLKEICSENKEIHHKNFCKIDNQINNLKLMDKKEHTKLHHRNKKVSKETRKKMSESQKGRKLTKEHREKLSQSSYWKGRKKNNPILNIKWSNFRYICQPYSWDKQIKISYVNLETCKKKVENFINSSKNDKGYENYQVILNEGI